MRVLYAFQGTGNGHAARAKELLPALRSLAEVDVLVSSAPPEKAFDVPVDLRYHGVGFRFGRRGGIDFKTSFRELNSRNFFKEVRNVPVGRYDLVINDFEPVTAWACRQQGVPVVGLSHQAAVLHPASPKPHNLDWFSSKVLQHYAPTKSAIGLHFQAYAQGIHTPVIRQVVRELDPVDNGHITVYLPAYNSANIFRVLKHFPRTAFQVFSPRWQKPFWHDRIRFFPASDEAFTRSMAASAGVLCGAGFETPAEALSLGKPLLVVPMQGQLEQQCNAQALQELGVPVIPRFTTDFVLQIQEWLSSPTPISISYPDEKRVLLAEALSSVSRVTT